MEQLPTIATAINILASISNFVRRPYHGLRVLVFRLQNRLMPYMDNDRAMAVAFATLGGSVIAAIPYRDLGNPHRLIVVMRRPHDETVLHRIYLLEEFGKAWRVKWESEDLSERPNLDAFGVHDFDGDGICEISFLFASYGTGGGGETVYLHVPARGRTYSVDIGRFWADLSAPPVSQIRVGAIEKDDEVYIRGLERICDQLGLTQPVPLLNLDDPKNAVLRWHKENGKLLRGRVRTHLYDGRPAYQSTPVLSLEDGDYVWSAYFKGPVYGYIKSQDKHFVVYCPALWWDWASCLTADNRYLWIGLRFDGILRFDKKKQFLWQFELQELGIDKDAITEVSSIETRDGYFLVNGRFKVNAEILEHPCPWDPDFG